MKIRIIILFSITMLLIGCMLDRRTLEAPKAESLPAPKAESLPVPKAESSPVPSIVLPQVKATSYLQVKPSGSYYHYMEAHLQQRKNNLEKAIESLNRAIELDPESMFLKKELALLSIQQKDHGRALEIVEGLVKKNDGDVELLVLYGRLKQASKQMDAAKEIYEKVLAKDPKQENVYMMLGSIFMGEKSYDRAFDVYRRLVEHFPASYVGNYFIGKIHFERGDLAAAEKAYKKTLELQPELEEPLAGLVEIYKSNGQTEKVIETYREIIRTNSNNIGAILEFGLYQHAVGNTAAAEKLLEPVGADLSDPAVLQKIVEAYLNPKKYEEALTILTYMMRGQPDSSDLHYLTGVAYSGLDDDAAATAHFQKVDPGSRFYSNAVVHIAFAYQEKGDMEQAIRLLSESRKHLPEDPEILLYLGSFYEEIEDFEKAVKILQEGIELDPKHVRLHFRLGVVNDKWGRKPASIEIMKKVIQLDPQNANALNYLGYTYADSGENLEEAERLIKEALKYKPDDGYITDSLAWVYYKMGSYQKAVELLEKAVTLVPDDPIILEHLGDAYLKINDPIKALDYYRRSLLYKKKDKEDIEKKIETLTGRGI